MLGFGPLCALVLADAGVVAASASINGAIAVGRAFDWVVINTGSGTATMTAGVGHTIVGLATVAAATSARFRTRKTAANTFVTYRI